MISYRDSSERWEVYGQARGGWGDDGSDREELCPQQGVHRQTAPQWQPQGESRDSEDCGEVIWVSQGPAQTSPPAGPDLQVPGLPAWPEELLRVHQVGEDWRPRLAWGLQSRLRPLGEVGTGQHREVLHPAGQVTTLTSQVWQLSLGRVQLHRGGQQVAQQLPAGLPR